MRHPPAHVALICVCCAVALAVFANKAVHIDDTMFLWAARQIQKSPLDFYGFDVNWEGVTQPMAEVMKNPPGVSYYQAAVASITGFREFPLHIAFIPWALACVAFTALLARRFDSHPGVAALLLVFSPAFFVSATTLMSDVMMLALWMATLWLWISGAEDHRPWLIWLAMLTLVAAVLTKYPALNLIPLLIVYTILERRHRASQIAALVVAALLLLVYELLTRRLYGRGLLSDAFLFAGDFRVDRPSMLWNLIVGASFTFFGLLGPMVAIATVRSDRLKRDARLLLLLLWIGGVFVFLSVVNWTANARTLLPMAPAISILAARHWPALTRPRRNAFVACSLLAAIVTFVAALADYKLANVFRTAAGLIEQRSAGTTGTVYFTGHWGFQWYMEKFAKPYDATATRAMPGDLIALMRKTTRSEALPAPAVRLIDTIDEPVLSFASTFSKELGAGFYRSSFGPMPYAFGRAPAERFEVYVVLAPIAPATKPVALPPPAQ